MYYCPLPYDTCQVKLFDFGGMDKRHLPFREVEPEEGNVVVSISYSGTGHAFLVCTAGSQPKVRSMPTSASCHALEINFFAEIFVLENILVILLSADSH